MGSADSCRGSPRAFSQGVTRTCVERLTEAGDRTSEGIKCNSADEVLTLGQG